MRVYDGSPLCRRTDILMFKRKKKIRLIVHAHMSIVMRETHSLLYIYTLFVYRIRIRR